MKEQAEIISAADLTEKFFENELLLSKQVYVEANHIVINVSYEYNIELSRCDSYAKILGWVTHLCEKTWMTKPIMRRFIELAHEVHNLPEIDS